MVQVDMKEKELGVTVLGRFVDFLDRNGEKVLELEIEPHRVDITRGNKYVTVYRNGPPTMVSDYASVLPTRSGYAIELGGYKVAVRWGRDYASVTVEQLGKLLAKVYGYGEGQE